MKVRAWFSCALLAVSLSASLTAQAAEPTAMATEPLRELGLRPRFGLSDGIFTGVMLSGSVLAQVAIPPIRTGWRGGILFDEASRGVFRSETLSGRRGAARASDVGLVTMFLAPWALDAFWEAGVRREDWGLSAQVFLVGLEAYATGAAVLALTKNVASRERPYGRECAADPGYDRGCGREDRYRSFFSGHTSVAFTGAGLLCGDRRYLGLRPEGGALGCPIALGVAASIGALRMMADQHYASDVLVGAAVGWASGYLLPYYLHYRGRDAGVVTLFPQVGPAGEALLVARLQLP
ncbi:MAG: phosphatase PAP2 family protein [Oligoflexia bacterium]|nr:phosphatase PAP2 family protein [Oligoflexia bacterium]